MAHLHFTYRNGSTLVEERDVDCGAYFSDEWKRMSTMGHPACSRPTGLDELTDLGLSDVSDMHSELDGIHIPLYSGAVDTFGPLTQDYNFYDNNENGSHFVIPHAFLSGIYSQTQRNADTCHINIPASTPCSRISDTAYMRNVNSNFNRVFLKRSPTTQEYYLLYADLSGSYPYCAFKPLGVDNPTDLYKLSAEFVGYGSKNPLYGSVSDAANTLNGWQSVQLPTQYMLNPCAYVAPASYDGIICLTSVYNGDALLIDPFDGVIDQFSIQTQGYAPMDQLCRPISTVCMQIGSMGIFYLDMDYHVLRSDGSYTSALYFDNTLIRCSGDDANQAGAFTGSWLTAYDDYGSFPVGTLWCIGSGTFYSIDDNFYIGSCFYVPLSSSCMYRDDYGGYTVIRYIGNAPEPWPMLTLDVAEAIAPPSGATTMEVELIMG